jgi:hypothetical protein
VEISLSVVTHALAEPGIAHIRDHRHCSHGTLLPPTTTTSRRPSLNSSVVPHCRAYLFPDVFALAHSLCILLLPLHFRLRTAQDLRHGISSFYRIFPTSYSIVFFYRNFYPRNLIPHGHSSRPPLSPQAPPTPTLGSRSCACFSLDTHAPVSVHISSAKAGAQLDCLHL